jgi:hypothetical protein
MEIWKDIKGYEGRYQISSLGRVKSLISYFGTKEKIMKGQPVWTGYLRVCLVKDGKSKMHTIHRMVAEAFIPNPENKPIVNHIDGNITNNRVDNLEWVTYAENSNKSKNVTTSDRWNSTRVIDSNGNIFDSYREAGRYYGISPNTIKNDCIGVTEGKTKRKIKFRRIEK